MRVAHFPDPRVNGCEMAREWWASKRAGRVIADWDAVKTVELGPEMGRAVADFNAKHGLSDLPRRTGGVHLTYALSGLWPAHNTA